MPRHKDHAGGPYDKLVGVMLNDEALAALDKFRGEKSRSAFLRDLLRLEAQKRTPNEGPYHE